MLLNDVPGPSYSVGPNGHPRRLGRYERAADSVAVEPEDVHARRKIDAVDRAGRVVLQADQRVFSVLVRRLAGSSVTVPEPSGLTVIRTPQPVSAPTGGHCVKSAEALGTPLSHRR